MSETKQVELTKAEKKLVEKQAAAQPSLIRRLMTTPLLMW